MSGQTPVSTSLAYLPESLSAAACAKFRVTLPEATKTMPITMISSLIVSAVGARPQSLALHKEHVLITLKAYYSCAKFTSRSDRLPLARLHHIFHPHIRRLETRPAPSSDSSNPKTHWISSACPLRLGHLR